MIDTQRLNFDPANPGTTSEIGSYVLDGAGTPITSTLLSGKQGLDVNVIDGITVGVIDESAFTAGVSTEQTIGGVFNDSITALTSGQQGAVRLTANRSMHVTMYTPADVAMGDTAPHKIFVQPTDGTNSASYTSTGQAQVNASQFTSSTATLTQVAGAITSFTILASNAARKGMIIFNDCNKAVSVAFAATATLAAFTIRLQAGNAYETDSLNYTGAVSGISTTGVTGNVVITELT